MALHLLAALRFPFAMDSPRSAVTPLALGFGLSLLFIGIYYLCHSRSATTLPPGPRPLPVIGNFLHIPNVRPWEAYRQLCQEHGAHALRNCDMTQLTDIRNQAT